MYVEFENYEICARISFAIDGTKTFKETKNIFYRQKKVVETSSASKYDERKKSSFIRLKDIISMREMKEYYKLFIEKEMHGKIFDDSEMKRLSDAEKPGK